MTSLVCINCSNLHKTKTVHPCLLTQQSQLECSKFSFLVPAKNEFVSLAEMEDALLKNLFQGYQRWVRPIQRANDTIKVRFGLKISQLVDVVR